MGPLDTGEIFLQGWAVGLPRTVRVIVAHDGFVPGELRSAGVERNDLRRQRQGFCRPARSGRNALDPEKIQKVFFRTRKAGDTWMLRPQGPAPMRDVPAHIRDGIPRAAPIRRRCGLRRAGERFDGRDTVSTLGSPCASAWTWWSKSPAAALLCRLDARSGGPANSVVAAGGRRVRVDDGWTRLPRPDVSAAFQQNDFSRDVSTRSATTTASSPLSRTLVAGDAPVYFEFEIDDSVAFYPLYPADCPAAPLSVSSRRWIRGQRRPQRAIERHIGPMMQARASPITSWRPRLRLRRRGGLQGPRGWRGDAEEVGVTLSARPRSGGPRRSRHHLGPD